VKLNRGEEKAEAAQSPSLKELLGRISQEEREASAWEGSLSEWLLRTLDATPTDSQADEKESNITESKRLK
jgi:hypothetical protein